jgi:flagellar hook-basal body complex protein FliE
MTVAGVGGVASTPFVAPTLKPTGATPAQGTDFAKSLEQVSKLSTDADGLAQGVATGQLQDVHQFTTAAAKAQLGVEMTVALRNRAVESYQEIMRMQV